jgi:hypothetical protein
VEVVDLDPSASASEKALLIKFNVPKGMLYYETSALCYIAHCFSQRAKVNARFLCKHVLFAL